MVWEEEHTTRMKNKSEHALKRSYMTMASFSVTEKCGGNCTRNIYGMRVRRLLVRNILKELDPEGCVSRKANKLKLREYLNPGPTLPAMPMRIIN